LGLVLEIIFVVFLSSSCRETAKNAIKKIEAEKRQGLLFFPQLFWQKAFDMDFLQNVLWCFKTPLVEKRTKTPLKKKPPTHTHTHTHPQKRQAPTNLI
jgi:hypothetical protein